MPEKKEINGLHKDQYPEYPESEPLTKQETVFGSKPKGRKKCTDFDDILNIIGSEGRFQKIFLYLILSPIVTVAPFLDLSSVFLLDIPDHWCHVPGNYMEIDQWKNLTIPMEHGPDGLMRYSQCKMFALNTTPFSSEGEENPVPTVDCQFGWEFSKADYESTIPSEFNWVCDKVEYATDSFTAGIVGNAVGSVIFGILADKLGRRPIFFLACLLYVICKGASLLVPQYLWAYMTLLFLAGTAFPPVFNIPTIMIAEICGPEYRSWTYAIVWMVWVIGNSLLPLVVWVSRDWLIFGGISVIIGLLPFIYYPTLTESPRWLITVGKGDEALKIIKKIAKTNGVLIKESEMKEMIEEMLVNQKEDQADKNIGFWTLFQNFRLAKHTVLLCIAWSMNALLYYGITLNSTSMAGNKFLNYFLLSLIELPSGYLAGVLVEKTGRRWTQAGFFLMCMISCFICAIAVAHANLPYLVIFGALGIKFGVTITYLVVYLQGTEIFPTQLRSTGSGLAATVSAVIGSTGPHIVFTGKLNAAFPYTIFGILSAIGILSSVSLPETFRQHLPETIDDANNFGKGVKFWSYLPKDKNVRNDDENGCRKIKS